MHFQFIGTGTGGEPALPAGNDPALHTLAVDPLPGKEAYGAYNQLLGNPT